MAKEYPFPISVRFNQGEIEKIDQATISFCGTHSRHSMLRAAVMEYINYRLAWERKREREMRAKDVEVTIARNLNDQAEAEFYGESGGD